MGTGWYLDGTWMVPGWDLDGTWMGPGWDLDGTWMSLPRLMENPLDKGFVMSGRFSDDKDILLTVSNRG